MLALAMFATAHVGKANLATLACVVKLNTYLAYLCQLLDFDNELS